jgi:hypothetical protein
VKGARVLPDISTPACAKAVEFENGIRGQAFENGAFIAPDGRVLLRKTGLPDRIGYDEDDLIAMAGNLFTHNHPGGLSFSLRDIALAIEFGFSELRAVTRNLRHIAMPIHSWPPLDVFLGVDALGLGIRVAQKVDAMVKSDRLHVSLREFEYQHQYMVELARVLNFRYWREIS